MEVLAMGQIWTIFWLAFFFVATPIGAKAFTVLCYHDVQEVANDPDGMTVSTTNLAAQFAWLRENGYKVVGIDDLLAAREGKRPLPEKAVLLSFDDGYASFYRTVFPLLKAFNYQAVLALVGRWIETPAGETVPYGDQQVPREHFMSWEEIREVADSELVEVASHSYDLHHGEPANPQGNTQPAMTTYRYDSASGRYETDEAYRQRLAEDFARNADLFKERLGRRPRVMVWPYGEYNGLAQELASERGMEVALTLESGDNQPENLASVRRDLVLYDPGLGDFVWTLRHPTDSNPPQRVVHADLDYVYDPDPVQQEANLGRLLERVKTLGVSTVYLQAFADPDGDGVAEALYFPNRHLPVRADLFNRAAWQLRTRAGVRVYAWMPLLAFAVGDESDQVLAWRAEGEAAPDPTHYRRLSPFSAHARRLIGEIYEDLAKHAPFAGVLFHDDAFLSDFEDAHPEALVAYKKAGLPGEIGRLRDEAELRGRWTGLKVEALHQLTGELAGKLRYWRPGLKTARNLYARPILEPASVNWFAQSLPRFLEHYDYTAVMAMPYMEKAEDPETWLATLAAKIEEHPGALDKVVFELQSVDWRRDNAPIPAETLVRWMRLLERWGARHYGYYPDDFPGERPEIKALMPVMSLRTFPYQP